MSKVHNVLNIPETEINLADVANKHDSAERIGLVRGTQKVLQQLKLDGIHICKCYLKLVGFPRSGDDLA